MITIEAKNPFIEGWFASAIGAPVVAKSDYDRQSYEDAAEMASETDLNKLLMAIRKSFEIGDLVVTNIQ